MTTIAWDGTTLAGDKKRTIRGVPTPATKIFRANRRAEPCMILYGCAGEVEDCIAFQRWILHGQAPGEFKCISVIAVDEDARVWQTQERMVWVPIPLAKWAIGSGGEFAMGAMAAGKTAAEAIEIAAELDSGTGLGVDTLTLGN